ncbi:hypothetical protein D3C81_937630 [compost metagenome]
MRDGVTAGAGIELFNQAAHRQQAGTGVMAGAIGQLLFITQALADVFSQHQTGIVPVEFQPGTVRLHVEEGAILALVPVHGQHRRLAGGRAEHRAPYGVVIFRRTHVQDRHGQELFAAEAVLVDRGLVHFEKPQCSQVEDPERCRVAVKHQAELPLRFLCARLDVHTLADVHHRTGQTRRLSGAVDPFTACRQPAQRSVSHVQAEHRIQRTLAVAGMIEHHPQPRAVLFMNPLEEFIQRGCARRQVQHLLGQQ